MPGVDYEESLLYPKPPRGKAGTEHRDSYKTLYDATVGAASASKPPFALGGDTTSSLIGLPWCQAKGVPTPTWQKMIWAPATTPAGHYRPTSAEVGSMSVAPFHMNKEFTKAKESASVRYLQAPYLVGDMAAGAGLDARPTSSVSTFSLVSDKQAEILASGEQRLGERIANTTSWTMARSLRSKPITPSPEPYMTSTAASYKPRPPADSQQHRLRGFTTSQYVPARTLDSAPMGVSTPALATATALHATRYLGVRDSDGGRRLLEIITS